MKNKTVVLTGASEGIGEALALALAAQGANLVLAARNQAKLNGVRQRCQAQQAQVLAVQTDVAKREDCQNLIQQAVGFFGGLDVLINNAGISMSVRFDDIDDLSIFERLMRVNYLGVVHCTHHALPHLKTRRGLLVAISSWQGKAGFPLSSGYAASKHALQGLCDSLRIELYPHGVDVLVVSPGPVDTAIHSRKFGRTGNNGGAVQQQDLMSPEQCAQLIVQAIARRERDVVLTLRGKLIPWLKLIAPRVLDQMLARGVEEFYTKPQ